MTTREWLVANQRLIAYWVRQITSDKSLVQDRISQVNLRFLTNKPLEHYDPAQGPLRPYLKVALHNALRMYSPQQVVTVAIKQDLPDIQHPYNDFAEFCRWYKRKGYRIAHDTILQGRLNLQTLTLLLAGNKQVDIAHIQQVTPQRICQRVRQIRKTWALWRNGFYLL